MSGIFILETKELLQGVMSQKRKTPSIHNYSRHPACTSHSFGGLSLASQTQEELERVSLRIGGSIKIHPHFFDLDRGLIDSPGVVAGLQASSTALFQFWSVLLH